MLEVDAGSNHPKKFGESIWIIDGPSVPWFGMPYTTRTTVIRLDNGDLFIHSPGKLTPELKQQVDALGEVKHLVSPNKIHHLFLGQRQEKYPLARLYASPGVRDKRQDLEFDEDLLDTPCVPWQDEVDQLIFRGSKVMEEVVFFHRKTATLILTDLIENFPQNHFSGYQKLLAKFTGILSPSGKTPIDWRLTFLFHKSEARMCMQHILNWKPEKIIIAHGECILNDAQDFLKRSFSWLGQFHSMA